MLSIRNFHRLSNFAAMNRVDAAADADGQFDNPPRHADIEGLCAAAVFPRTQALFVRLGMFSSKLIMDVIVTIVPIAVMGAGGCCKCQSRRCSNRRDCQVTHYILL